MFSAQLKACDGLKVRQDSGMDARLPAAVSPADVYGVYRHLMAFIRNSFVRLR
jgi:hypothetical protein